MELATALCYVCVCVYTLLLNNLMDWWNLPQHCAMYVYTLLLNNLTDWWNLLQHCAMCVYTLLLNNLMDWWNLLSIVLCMCTHYWAIIWWIDGTCYSIVLCMCTHYCSIIWWIYGTCSALCNVYVHITAKKKLWIDGMIVRQEIKIYWFQND